MAKRIMQCTFCGNHLEDYEVYCSECGESVVRDDNMMPGEDNSSVHEEEGVSHWDEEESDETV